MEKIIRFGITDISVSKPPFLEWFDGLWRVWVAYNSTLSSGSYIVLHSDGRMIRTTLQNNVVMEISLIN